MNYLLPHHDTLTSLDPLDICGDHPEQINENGTVQHKHIINALLDTCEADLNSLESRSASTTEWASCFGDIIQNLAYSLHNVGDLNVGFLRLMLESHSLETLGAFRHNLFRFARSLSQLFPEGCLEFLSTTKLEHSFSPKGVDSLLAHLLLGTVQIPKGNGWGRPGYTTLYRADPVVPSAVTGCLTTLIDHFSSGGYSNTVPSSTQFTWTLSATSVDVSPETLSNASQKAARITPVIKAIASEPTPLADGDTFVLLSAHSEPGPGPAGTHEERLMGQSPALAITSLICPKLEANIALVTSTFPVHASWEGHNRYSKLVQLYEPRERVRRRYIIADAAELDVADHDGTLPDLKPGVVEREVGKLEAGFGGCMRVLSTGSLEGMRPRIEVVPWGCQAFGGNLVVKAQCMMMAAGLAGIDEVHLLVSSDREHQAKEIETIVEQHLTVGDMYKKLRL